MTRKASKTATTISPARRRILVVDDHAMMRAGMKQLINGEADMEVCGEAGNADDALRELSRCRPDLLVTDLSMPGRDGIQLIRDALALHPKLPILVVSMHDEMTYARRALSAGARGYLMKDAGVEDLPEAIRAVLAGRTYVSKRLSGQVLNDITVRRPRGSNSPIEKLSRREFEVFRLIGTGMPTREIASQLHLSENTVAVHRVNIKRKLEIATIPELVSHAVRWVVADSAGR